METLDVEPPVLRKVEELAEFLVDFSVTVRPHTCLAKSKQGMHPCSEEMGVIFFSDEI